MDEIIVEELIEYAQSHLGLNGLDSDYVRNILMDKLNIHSLSEKKINKIEIDQLKVPDSLIEILKDQILEEHLIEENRVESFICSIMGILSYRPEKMIEVFHEVEKKKGLEEAFNYFYTYQIDNDYVKKTSIGKNKVWSFNDENNQIDISINLSKPEKKNSDIAKSLNTTEKKYPSCVLCKENLGFWGKNYQNPRQNIRLIPMNLNHENWFFQFSPYGYFYQHGIIFKEKHEPMVIDVKCFNNLLDFVDHYPFYFVGSNADLPIVGGSILNHEHFQCGKACLPLFKSKVDFVIEQHKYPHTTLNYMDWYNSTLMLEGTNRTEISVLSQEILEKWKYYSDEKVSIYSSKEDRHNTITPLCIKKGDKYYLYLILRNNGVNKLYPDGIFHAHSEFHHIKSEGIGLIEAAGLFILPSRLKRQMGEIEKLLCSEQESVESLYSRSEDMKIHHKMIEGLCMKYGRQNEEVQAKKYIKNYINATCKAILLNTGVFKKDDAGKEALNRFIKCIFKER